MSNLSIDGIIKLMSRPKIGLLSVFLLVVGITALWRFGYLPAFEDVQESRDAFHSYAMTMPVTATFLFSLVYIAIVALSITLAAVFSLLSGFLFGSVVGTVIVVISATIGATIIFLLARYFFRDYFESKIGVSEQSRSFGTFSDVLVARLVPAIPFSLINIVAGLTRVSLRNYVIATAIGIIPFSFVYVHAGEALGEIQSLRDIASSELWMFVSRIALVIAVLYIIKRVHSARSAKNSTHS